MSGRSEEDELTALELALRELRPRRETIPRDVLMYRAGRASLRSWFWPSTAAMTTTVAVLLGVVLLLRPAPPVVERIVYVTAPANPASGGRQPPEAPNQGADAPRSPAEPEPLHLEPLPSDPRGPYRQLQERVLRLGLNGIPPPPPAPPLPEPPTVEQLLRSL